MGSPDPTRTQGDLADVVEMLLDKGVVVNADIAVSVGDTELLGIQIRAAVASFETAAQYGMEFPAGTDQDRVERAATAGRGRGDAEEDNEAHQSRPDGPAHLATRPHVSTGRTGGDAGAPDESATEGGGEQEDEAGAKEEAAEEDDDGD